MRIERFAKELFENVRDPSIALSEVTLDADEPGPQAERWRKAAKEGGAQQCLHVAIPDIVDEVIFRLLHEIDSGRLRLAYLVREDPDSDSGTWVDLCTLANDDLGGEMAAEVASPGGWRDRFASERMNRYLPDDVK